MNTNKKIKIDLKKINGYIIAIFVILLLNLNICYLVMPQYPIAFGLAIDDICLLFSLGFFAYTMFNFRRSNVTFVFRWEIVMVIVLALLSAYAGTKSYSQPFMLGFRPQRHWLVFMLLYFPIRLLLKRGQITVSGLSKMLYVYCFLYFAVTILQYLLHDVAKFTYVLQNERYDDARFYFEDCYVMLLLSIALSDFFNARKKFSLIIVGICIFFLVVVAKGRMAVVSVALSTLIALILSKGSSKQKFFRMVLVGIAAVCVLQTSMVQDLILDASGGKHTGSTSQIREEGREFYMEELKESPIIGKGMINTEWPTATKLGGVDDYIYVVDNGMFGMAFYYGGIGVLWWLILTFKCMRMSYVLLKRNRNFGYICYFMTTIFGCVTLPPNCFENSLAFVLGMAMMEHEYGITMKLGRR